MTGKEMEAEIIKRTKLPAWMVRSVLSVQIDLMREALSRQEKVEFKGLLKIHSATQHKSFIDPKTNLRASRDMIILSVRPVRRFREELNRWTSTVSQQTKK